MAIKTENKLSNGAYEQMTQLCSEICPPDNKVPKTFHKSKSLMKDMGLPVEKIDCCINGCILYWGDEDSKLDLCRICGHPRYKEPRRKGPRGQVMKKTNKLKKVPHKKMYYLPIIPRLMRLYQSSATTKHMTWHATNASPPNSGELRHPADSLAWKHLDSVFPDFASEPRNVRLGLSTDGFAPFGMYVKQYSLWPVILTPYNLPPWMGMKAQTMFLTVLVPGPSNPKDKLDVYLQPLIKDLIFLWENGVDTYDVSRKQNFTMRAAVLWTISDFPAYAMLSGWSTAGMLACPYCMEHSDAFTLQDSRKQSWFDNHRKFLPRDHPFRRNKDAFIKKKTVTNGPPPIRTGDRLLTEIIWTSLKKSTEENAAGHNKLIPGGWKKKSIFWDLPYWSSLLIRHNLDVMHIEKNMFDNVFHTIMNTEGKTKDTPKSRDELNTYCRREELKKDERTGKYPKACYTLDKPQKQAVCRWIQELNFPEDYVSKLSRCVDTTKGKVAGMKSHDCQVFMQRLIPIAFRELLPPKCVEGYH